MTANNSHIIPNEPTRLEAHNLEELLIHCYNINASDITLQTNSQVMAEIYGQLYKVTNRQLSNTEMSELLNALYGPNGTTQLMSGTDVDTHYEIRPNRNDRYRYRVNGTACHVDGHEGIQITLRTIPSSPPTLASLALPAAVIDAIAPQEGVVYITGATGSGKSTLLAAIMRKLCEEKNSNRKILTYEAPIEFVYDNVQGESAIISQSEIPRNLPSFAAGVRNALRRKPHAILVGETRDTETINAVMEAALTGHPVYTTLHTNGVSETIRRLVGSFPRDEQITRSIDIIETVRLIIWQRLVPATDGTRVALREYLIFTEEIRDQLLNCNLDNITATIRALVKKYGQTMVDDIEKNYKNKLISERTYEVLMKGCHTE
jgi:defect-in-organelle-trafficking protein DotB